MTHSRLFQPLRVGNASLAHRMVMAPLTRFRADDRHVPTKLAAEYYVQRASTPGTLIISEATFISKTAGGYPNVPGIWNDEQVQAWKTITDAVHAKGSRMYLQLWALGRVAMPSVAEAEGFEILSASAKPFEAGAPIPREATIEEIQRFIQEYAQAARNAMEAGFDGVEIHGAGGYLIDQFTEDDSNQRTDVYGGNIQNRSRFIVEVACAVSEAVGPHRVGVRLSPWQRYQGMRMDDPIPQFTHVIQTLSGIGLGYLHLIEARVNGNVDCEASDSLNFAIDAWTNGNPIIMAGGYTPESAKHTVDQTLKDRDVLIAFGRSFIANPDLPYRIECELDLNPYDRDTFYAAGSSKGYTDYPFSDLFKYQKSLDTV